MSADGHIDYEALAQAAMQSAMQSIVRDVLTRVAKSGLPGQHHFYIAFNTSAPGVVLSTRLLAKYPHEMTIVLQHRFWDLAVNADRFEVKLTFDGIPERLCVPFSAIKVFFDPSVPYGLQLEDVAFSSDGAPPRVRPLREDEEPVSAQAGNGSAPAAADKKPRSQRKPKTEKGTDAARRTPERAKPALVVSKPTEAVPADNDTKVISLAKFRKKSADPSRK